MDKGAHFYRCDFQVHSPRDPGWIGNSPSDSEGRRAYAEALVAACRVKGITAIAITDHHDLTFFPFIKAAAEEERSENGDLLPTERRLVVFPGMELTLGVPCQAIIIFDADFPLEFLTQAITILGITPSPENNAKHAQAQRIDHIRSIRELSDRFAENSAFRGKFIILPNVTENGHGTVIRQGFSAEYKDMPVVGGYLDCLISDLGNGASSILSGKDKSYGFKKLGLFQTSDNRAEDHRDLGKRTTWVKWSTPTAEALRQACLAQESRISQEAPHFPSYQIELLQVSNSRFMGPLDVQFNPQFNAFIGGRGTGKSSILEYVRWALCDTPLVDPDDENSHSLEAKRQQLIENTLKTMQGEVRIEFSLNGVKHVVRRNSSSGELQVKVEAGTFETISTAQVRQLFPIHAYSQKQLSGVGVKQAELFRFLQAPVESELSRINEALDRNALSIKANYQHLQRQRSLEQTARDTESQIKSLSSQVQKLKDNLSGVSAEDKEIIDRNEKVLAEQSLVRSYSQSLEQLTTNAESLVDSLKRASTGLKLPSNDAPNANKLKIIHQQYSKLISNLEKATASISKELSVGSSSRTDIETAIQDWTLDLEAQKAQYEKAKLRYSAHETTLKEISSLEEQIKGKQEGLEQIRSELDNLSHALLADDKLRLERRELLGSRMTLIKGQCNTLNELSEGALHASLKILFNGDDAAEQLKVATAGAKIRGKQFENLFTQVSEDPESDNLWQDVLKDLEALTASTIAKSEQLPDAPTLAKLGFPAKELPKLAQYLTADSWLALSLIPPKEEVVFMYRVREGEYIPFSQASAGQQATVLLGILLNQAGPPLIIDQPEDDLDNQVIQEIVSKVWSAKKKRQLIFTSHNANLVVNGDAELVVCCGYRNAGDHSGGTIQTIGAIDLPDVRSSITNIMEGGQEAFNLRRQKYGF